VAGPSAAQLKKAENAAQASPEKDDMGMWWPEVYRLAGTQSHWVNVVETKHSWICVPSDSKREKQRDSGPQRHSFNSSC